MRLGKEREEVSVVADQIGSPTYVADLNVMINKLIHTSLYGTYHVSNRGSCSWFEFAKKNIFVCEYESECVTSFNRRIWGCSSKAEIFYFPTQHAAIKWFLQMPSWEEGLERFFIETKSH